MVGIGNSPNTNMAGGITIESIRNDTDTNLCIFIGIVTSLLPM